MKFAYFLWYSSILNRGLYVYLERTGECWESHSVEESWAATQLSELLSLKEWPWVSSHSIYWEVRTFVSVCYDLSQLSEQIVIVMWLKSYLVYHPSLTSFVGSNGIRGRQLALDSVLRGLKAPN